MTDILSLDWETKSEIDLFERGLDIYARHPSTKVLMGAFKFNGGSTEQWVPAEGERMPSDLKEALRDPSVVKIGFNSQFERWIANHVLGIETPIESWRCSMALAYMFSFMGGLDDICKQMSLTNQKDPRGRQLLKIFCEPNKPTKNQPFVWRDQYSDPREWEEFKRYNIRDEDTEWELWTKLSRFHVPEWQWELYHLDQIINDRGMPINRTFVENALDIATRRKSELISEQNRITGLANSNSATQLLPWLEDRGYPFHDLQKDSISKALAAEVEEVRLPSQVWDREAKALVTVTFEGVSINEVGHVVGDAIMTQECRTVTRMRQSSSKTSTTKYSSCLAGIADDYRLRHCFQFAGGSRTNRWAGRKIQPQNLPRTPKWLEPEDYIDFDRLEYCNMLIETNDYYTLGVFAGEQMDAVAGCVRSCIQAGEGKTLVVADLASIESVVIFWITDCKRGMEAVRAGLDLYKDFATVLYGVLYTEVTKAQRSGAKPAVLGAGYRLSGGDMRDGKKTGLWGYAENMNVRLTREESHKAVDTFREVYHEIKSAWYSLEDTIERAMRAGGKPVKWGRLTMQVEKPFFKIILPSGRPMWYYKLRCDKQEIWSDKYERFYTKTVISYFGKCQITQQWKRIESHGGKFIENVVQAVARDILGLGMLAASKAGFNIVLHVHDEIGCEENEGCAVFTLEKLIYYMTDYIRDQNEWLCDLPLAAAGYSAKTYRKD